MVEIGARKIYDIPPPWGAAKGDREMERLERLLDQAFRVPGLGVRIGLDGLIGLVPGVGDTATAALAGLIVLAAWRRGARRRTLLRMGLNVGIDWLVGAVPLAGDLFDFAYKANMRNLRLLREDIAEQTALQAQGSATRGQ